MNTYFVTGTYTKRDSFTTGFNIVFDLRPVNAENFKRQIRLELGINEKTKLRIENVVKL